MATNPYDMLFTDQNLAREFIIQPYTKNGPTNPTGGVDPSAATANTTLFLYGQGTPDYGERIQENLIFMLEHFFNPTEPSFPIPGQIWFRNNDPGSASQLYVYNPRKYSVVSSSGNVIAIQSTNGLDSLTTILSRFAALGTSKSFTVFSPTYTPLTFTQQSTPGYPQISGSMVLLSVTPAAPVTSLAGWFTGGWEDIFQGNCVNVLRTNFNANLQFIQNLPTPLLPGDAANKAYVDAAITGGTLTLSSLSDVQFATPGVPQNDSFLFFNGTKWTDLQQATMPFLALTGGTMSGAVNMGGQYINNILTPVLSGDAATKGYVDAQPLSGQFVTLTTPVNNNLLVYNSALTQWINTTATSAGILPLSGGTMTGTINMGGNILTGVPSPVNPTDAVNLSYVTSAVGGGVGIVVSGNYASNTGTLTLDRAAPYTAAPIIIPGFLPTQSINATYLPPDPASEQSVPGLFFQSTLSNAPIGAPTTFEDPINVRVNSALAQVDQALGNYTIPRQHIVLAGDGAHTVYNLNTGAPVTVTSAPNIQYVVGYNNVSVYINGVKQIPSDNAFYKLAGVNTTTTFTGITFTVGGSVLAISGNHIRTFHQGVSFVVSGTSTSNNGSYLVVSSLFDGTNTQVTVTPNLFSTTPGTLPFVTSTTGTITYGPFGILPAMETGYVFGGPSNPVTLSVTVNGLTPVNLTIDTSTTNCNNFGLLAQAVNAYASAYYINNVVSTTAGALGSFVVAGNRTTQFTTGTSFVVRYSSTNSGTYTVGPGAPTYAGGQTTIPITGTVPTSASDGIIFQDSWGFTIAIEAGSIIFYSNIPGAGSSVTPADGGMFAGITGITWPVTITTPLTGTTNPLTPTTYAYAERGLHGQLSSIIEFVNPPSGPPTPEFIEIVVDHEMVYSNINPFSTAVTA